MCFMSFFHLELMFVDRLHKVKNTFIVTFPQATGHEYSLSYVVCIVLCAPHRTFPCGVFPSLPPRNSIDKYQLLCFPYMFFYSSLSSVVSSAYASGISWISVSGCVYVCLAIYVPCNLFLHSRTPNGVSKCLGRWLLLVAWLCITTSHQTFRTCCVYIIHCEIERILQAIPPTPPHHTSHVLWWWTHIEMIYGVCFWLCVLFRTFRDVKGQAARRVLKIQTEIAAGKPMVFSSVPYRRLCCVEIRVHYLCEKANRCRSGYLKAIA